VEVAELDLLAEHGRELRVPGERAASVRRVEARVGECVLSALQWGSGPPELVLLHGGGQNAHTWDGVLLRSRRPALALDLPGHGRSSWPGRYLPREHAPLVAAAIEQLAPEAHVVIGMSLGGLTAMCVAAWYPELVRRLVIVDVSPGSGPGRAQAATDLSGTAEFPSFAALLARTREFRPEVPEESLRRSLLYNARELADGRWTWRHDSHPDRLSALYADLPSYWDVAGAIGCPTTLVVGGRSRIVAPSDVERYRAAIPQLDVVTVADAGHSVQGDRPHALLDVVEGDAGAQ